MVVPANQPISSKIIEDHTDQPRQKIWPYLVLVSCFLSILTSSGFNFGVVGSLTEVQQIEFNITLDQSSWTGSVHTAVFLSTGMFILLLNFVFHFPASNEDES